MNEKKYSILIWSVIILGIVGIVFGIIAVVKNENLQTSGVLLDPVAADDYYKGPENAKITLVEYSDFQCPACATFASMLKKLQADFPNDLKIVYRHFPLPNHKWAMAAAEAAEAAEEQGKFWEMNYAIFDNQAMWSNSDDTVSEFLSLAQLFKLDIAQFKVDAGSDKVRQKIEKNLTSGQRNKINATPTFFLNGNQIKNPNNYEDFKKLIEREINKK
ncbi:MAG: thioredoxin domain-containing protein [Patescibacteria group bacterium]|nr:thioredoxin domain-containing protein [Patescibacteria group bacterium]